ncbi:hypothetical protein G8S21_05525 [Clostridium botulinum C]|uniref:hypothetical protein n=1 Tax=Clostridium botulinum TaxID=1491 RepID=UPI001E32C9E7|nr:hypothetical protein [Clostridium botulinum]MCD3245405.1 hypothetical protein [Clostridium botulinum C]MCD3261784.1 hypothetical protein [Clostridium botulinum C]
MESRLDRELIINGCKERESNVQAIYNKKGNIFDCRHEIIKTRKLQDDLSLEQFQEDFDENNIDKLKIDFEKLDLIHKRQKEIHTILHIMQINNWTIKDIYMEYENGYTRNVLALLSKPNKNIW